MGEEIDKETLGGAAVQADKNGIADLAVDSEAEAFEAIRRFLSYLPANCRSPCLSLKPMTRRSHQRRVIGHRAIQSA